MVGQDLDINCFRSEKQTNKITFGEALGNLRKADSGEKPNKCDQCGYEFSRAFGLMRHLETHIGEKTKQMQPVLFYNNSRRQFEGTFENAQKRKDK